MALNWTALAVFIALFALANLRVGAQLPWVPPATVPIALSSLVAAAAVLVTVRQPRPRLVTALT